MRRIALAVAVATGLALGVSLPAFATHGGDTHPECADVTSGSFAYNVAAPDTTPNSVTGTITLATASCAGGAYTLNVFSSETSTTPLATQTKRSDQGRDGVVEFFVKNVVEADLTICVAVTTTPRTGTGDQAPNTGCQSVFADSPPGGEGFS